MSSENLYWLFSAAAQSIAALIAFLIAGLALAFSMMDRVADQDETLFEVVEALKSEQYKNLAALSVTTGLAIILSLLSVYLNPLQTMARDSVMIFALITDLAAILFAIYFVISIVSPTRYTRAARKEYKETKEEVPAAEGQEPSGAFFKEFISLEQDIRTYLKGLNLYVPSHGAPKMSYSFRQMVDALHQNEVIPSDLKNDLLKINKFRNLLFHGHLDVVDEGVIQSLRVVVGQWQNVKIKQQTINTIEE